MAAAIQATNKSHSIWYAHHHYICFANLNPTNKKNKNKKLTWNVNRCWNWTSTFDFRRITNINQQHLRLIWQIFNFFNSCNRHIHLFRFVAVVFRSQRDNSINLFVKSHCFVFSSQVLYTHIHIHSISALLLTRIPAQNVYVHTFKSLHRWSLLSEVKIRWFIRNLQQSHRKHTKPFEK